MQEMVEGAEAKAEEVEGTEARLERMEESMEKMAARHAADMDELKGMLKGMLA